MQQPTLLDTLPEQQSEARLDATPTDPVQAYLAEIGRTPILKREEELASIIDEQLTPDDVQEQHYRRLPVTVLPVGRS